MRVVSLFSHWEIRAVALSLAVMVYIFTGNLVEVDQSVSIRISADQVQGLNEGYQVRTLAPRELVIEVYGPRGAIEDFDPTAVQPVLAFSSENLAVGSQLFDVTPRLLQLPAELRLRHSSAQQIRVEVDHMVRAVLPVVVTIDDFSTGSTDALIHYFNLQQTHVEVYGPAGQVEELTLAGGLRVEPVTLTSIEGVVDEARELERVPLTLSLPDGVEAEERSVYASVTIGPRPHKRRVTLPLRVLAPKEFLDRYVVELHQPRVVLALHGPRDRILALDAERDLVAYVDLTGEPTLDIPYSRPVRVIRPLWLNVDEAQVRITVRLREYESVEGGLSVEPVVETLPDVALPSLQLGDGAEPDVAPVVAPK